MAALVEIVGPTAVAITVVARPTVEPCPLTTMSARILIVEDEPLIAMDIATSLSRAGYTIVGTTATAEKALELVEETRPDLVLMDIMLRGEMNGIEAAKIVRRDFWIPVVFLTAYSERNTVDRAKVAEPYGYILKPFTVATLRSTIEMALYKSGQDARSRRDAMDLAHVVAHGPVVGQLFVKDRGRNVRLALDQVLCVEALKDYMAIHTQGRRHIVHSTLQGLLQQLPIRDFAQVHRSYVVRVDRIATVEAQGIQLEGYSKRIPIGRAYHSGLMARLAPI